MNYIGDYKGIKVWRFDYDDKMPTDTRGIYVDAAGIMYYGGVKIGKLNLNSYKVLEYDMDAYHRKQKEESRKKVPVPACVAETATAVGNDGTLYGADEFFARVAKDIDEVLKSLKEF